MGKRNVAIDIAKAFGILLMILGHCNGLPLLLHNFIFSFHVPLFFILSGYFFKPQPVRRIASVGLKRLVVPYLVTSLACILICLLAFNPGAAWQATIGTVMSNGGTPHEMIGAKLPMIGAIWFLLALFWCRIFYACLKRITDQPLLASFVISTLALLVGKYVLNLPLGILTGCCGMVFYAMGDYWKNKMKAPVNNLYLAAGIIIWGICIWRFHVDLALFECSLYPITMLAAFVGTYTTYLVAGKIPGCLKGVLTWIGRNTLLILCYHTITSYLLNFVISRLLLQYGMTITGTASLIISFALGLGLPYLHTLISDRVKA